MAAKFKGRATLAHLFIFTTPLKLLDKFTYLGSRISSTEKDIDIIKDLLGLLEFHPPFGHFEFVRWLGST